MEIINYTYILMRTFVVALFLILSMGNILPPDMGISDSDLSVALECSPNMKILDFPLIVYGIAEGLFTSLKMTNGQRCIGQAEKTQEWIEELIKEIKECIDGSKGEQCYMVMMLKNLPTLMTVLAKLTTECPGALNDVEAIGEKLKAIFSNFQAYSQRLLLKLFGTIGNVINDVMNAYYGICQTHQFKKAGIQIGELVGLFLNI
jgi:hypothetical protein